MPGRLAPRPEDGHRYQRAADRPVKVCAICGHRPGAHTNVGSRRPSGEAEVAAARAAGNAPQAPRVLP